MQRLCVVLVAALAACGPPSPIAVVRLGDETLRFQSGSVGFAGGGKDPVVLRFVANERPGAAEGHALELQVVEQPGTTPAGFANHGYAGAVRAPSDPLQVRTGQIAAPVAPARAALVILRSTATGPGSTSTEVIPIDKLALQISAATTGTLTAQGTGTFLGDLEVPMSFQIELR